MAIPTVPFTANLKLSLLFEAELDGIVNKISTEPIYFNDWTWCVQLHRNANKSYGIYLIPDDNTGSLIQAQDIGLEVFRIDSRGVSLATQNFPNCVMNSNDLGKGFSVIAPPMTCPSKCQFKVIITHNKSYSFTEALKNNHIPIHRVDIKQYDDLVTKLTSFEKDKVLSTINEVTQFRNQISALCKEQQEMIAKLEAELKDFTKMRNSYADRTNWITTDAPSRMKKIIELRNQDIELIDKCISETTDRLNRLKEITTTTDLVNPETLKSLSTAYNMKMDELYDTYHKYHKELTHMDTLSDMMTSKYKEHVESLATSCKRCVNSLIKEAKELTDSYSVYGINPDNKYADLLQNQLVIPTDIPNYVIDPDEFICSITMNLLKDPVIAADGHTYEREAITNWLKDNNRSPITNQPLKNKELIPNMKLISILKTNTV
jgi:hypothetical protein